MKRLACVLLPLLGTFIPSVLISQTVNYFSDTVIKSAHNKAVTVVRKNQFLYVGGQSFDTLNNRTPSITKLDTAGNTVWSYTLNKEIDKQNVDGITPYGNGDVRSIVVDNNAVYALMFSSPGDTYEIWKLNATTGSLLWKKGIQRPVVFADADAGRLAYTYNVYGGHIYELIDKNTGRTSLSKVISQELPSGYEGGISFDTDGSAYITRNDSIYKYTSPELATESWRIRAINGGYVVTAIPQPGGQVYVVGHYYPTFTQPFFFAKINKSDGSQVWLTKAPPENFYDEHILTDYKFVQDTFYVSSYHRMFGSIFSAYHVWKISMTTGGIYWRSAYNPQNNPGPTTNARYAGTTSFDVDAHGNSYVTGYENGGDLRIGIWGISKFNRLGQLVYHKAVLDGAATTSNASNGVFASVMGNRVVYVGNLQRSSGQPGTDVHVITTDTSAMYNASRQARTVSHYQHHSAVREILPFSTDKYVVYKQVGNIGVVEMKNAVTGSTLWSKPVAKNVRFNADKMAITADKKIVVSGSGHLGSYMKYDYHSRMDTTYFIKFDSTGATVQEKKFLTRDFINYQPIQLYSTGDTNTVFVYNQRDVYGNYWSVHFYNLDRTTAAFGAFANYLAIWYSPIKGRQQLLIPRTRDSSYFMGTFVQLQPSSRAGFQQYKFNQAFGQLGYSAVAGKNTTMTVAGHYILNCDTSIVALAKENGTGRYVIFRYNFNPNQVVWSKTETDGTTIEGASVGTNHIYWTGVRNGSLVIRQVDKVNGNQSWEKIFAVSSGNQYYAPLDQKYNASRGQYTVCGYIGDSSTIITSQQAFYITLDSSGNTVRHWIQDGDYGQKNQLNSVVISPAGQTLIGGSLYKIPHGRSGVLIEADSPIIPILPPQTPAIAVTPAATICQGDSVTLTANSPNCNGCTYKWNDALNTTGNTLTVKIGGNYTVTVTNVSGTASASQTIVVNPIPAKPVVTLANSLLTSSATAGNQWFANGLAIPGATNQQLIASDTGDYYVQVTLNGCKSLSSDPVHFAGRAVMVDSGMRASVQFYPNPVEGRLNVSNTKSRQLSISIFDRMGNRVYQRSFINKDIQLLLHFLKAGQYFIQFRDENTGEEFTSSFVKQ